MKNTNIIETTPKTQPKSMFKTIIKKIASGISRLFEPEEVEVTFKVEGKNVTYTYTKVSHKQVA